MFPGARVLTLVLSLVGREIDLLATRVERAHARCFTGLVVAFLAWCFWAPSGHPRCR